MDFGILQQALGSMGSEYKIPGQGEPYAGNPTSVMANTEPYAGNPTQFETPQAEVYAEKKRVADEAASGLSGADASRAQANRLTNGEDPTIKAANDILAQNPNAQAAKAQTKVDYASEPVEMTGEQKRNNLKNKATSLVGAVANFYGGNWLGAAQSAKGFFDNSGEDKGPAGGLLGGAMGGEAGGAAEAGQATEAAGGANQAMGFLSKIFGG